MNVSRKKNPPLLSNNLQKQFGKSSNNAKIIRNRIAFFRQNRVKDLNALIVAIVKAELGEKLSIWSNSSNYGLSNIFYTNFFFNILKIRKKNLALNKDSS